MNRPSTIFSILILAVLSLGFASVYVAMTLSHGG